MASVNDHSGNIQAFHSKKSSGYYEGDYADQKLKDGYFSSSDPMDGYELAHEFSTPGEMSGAGRDGLRRGEDKPVYIYKKDEMPSPGEAPAAPSPTPEPVESEPTEVSPEIKYSPEMQQAKERVATYENDTLSGKTSQQVYGGAAKFHEKYKLNLSNNPQFKNNSDSYNFETDTAAYTGGGPVDPSSNYIAFNGSDISAKPTNNKNEQAAASFLQDQKNKTLKQYNIQPVS